MKSCKCCTAVVIFGPPGSGKGTQADILAKEYGLVHIDTGRLVESIVNDPKNQDDPIIMREKENFVSGRLMTPEWVLGVLLSEVIRLANEKQGIVFSGSPRTLTEAQELVPVLEKYYGKDSIILFRINVSERTSIFRNTHRRVCKKCRRPLIYSSETKDIDECPVCGGEIVVRSLDNEQAMKVRLKEYQERTKPIFEFLESRGYKIININGEPSPDEVAFSIQREFEQIFPVKGR